MASNGTDVTNIKQIKTINMNKSKLIDVVNNSASSIFTKEDVLKLLKQLSEGDYTAEDLENIREELKSEFDSLDADDIVDYDSAEFNIHENVVSLENIQTDPYTYETIIDNVFDCHLDR